ncbi:MAG TPA: 50S ribosomal protein L10 [Dehalococcoidia bacterium]|nr:50S ribosomal protein L10 [Dehalococcoidia bacterium]
MPTQKKIESVAQLRDRLQRASLVAGADYRGLTVKEMDQLRKRLRAAGLDVKVVKNTLLRLAAGETGQAEVMRLVEGPTALAFSYGDIIDAARALAEYAQAAPPGFTLRGAYLDGQVVSPEDLRELVRLPGKPVMIAQFLGHLQSPLAGFLGLLDAPLQELTLLLESLLGELPGLLEARARQLEAAP